MSGQKLVGILSILLVVALPWACGKGDGTVGFPDAGLLKGPYMGQSSPGMTPVKRPILPMARETSLSHPTAVFSS